MNKPPALHTYLLVSSTPSQPTITALKFYTKYLSEDEAGKAKLISSLQCYIISFPWSADASYSRMHQTTDQEPKEPI
eukprot:scaffold14465_cov77-Skeletonema_dohrnii-CCMP3373.AAC.4